MADEFILNETTITAVLRQIEAALSGQRGTAQRRIAEVGVDWVCTLLQKNSDYGCSAWKRPVLSPDVSASTAILCRMSDKVQRIATLSQGKKQEVAESLEDTVKDLGAYCLLWLAKPDEDN